MSPVNNEFKMASGKCAFLDLAACVMWASRHFDTTGSTSLQRNSALSMRTIYFPKQVSELVLQTGLTRPRSWTEEVSDLGRGLFSFAFLDKQRPLSAGNIVPRTFFDFQVCKTLFHAF
jgi:hypothetical protein